MKIALSLCAIGLCVLLPAGPAAAETRQPPMDAAAGAGWLPDTVTEDGTHMGSWTAGAKPAPATAKPAAPAAETAAAPVSGEEKIDAGHTLVVTSIQSCYDQLDPADVAEIKRNYLKPYAECQARLESKLQGKRELKAGEAQREPVPETPRNYIRVQQPEPAASPAPAAANTSGKSDTKPNP